MDISETQFRIDGNLNGQQALIKRALRRLTTLAPTRSNQRYAKKTAEISHQLFLRGWELTWSLPAINTLCDTVPSQCVSSSANEAVVREIESIAAQLDQLLNQVVDRTVRNRDGMTVKTDQTLRTRSAAFVSDTTAEAASIPPVTIVCTDAN